MPTRETPWPAGTPCWLDLAAPDLKAATDFYGAVFGWTFVDTGEETEHYTLAQVDGRAAAAIGKQQPGQPPAWTIYLATDDVDGTAKLITENGGGLLAEPFDVTDVGRMLVATDNTGGVFAAWQAGSSIGCEVYNEPGSLVWEDARLTDPEAGKRFYGTVFGYTYEAVEGAPDDYQTFAVDGEVAGGICGLTGMPEGTPSHWAPYFGVASVDDAVAAAERAGGTVVMPAENTPFGRMAAIVDPFGAAFMVHNENTD